jgi:hypothetical protein
LKDVLQGFRNRGLQCNEQTQLNEYVKAYFANVHPLLPVLHKDAFLALYRLHGVKAPTQKITEGLDASSLDGQAVSLICSVLALGALSLVETRDYSQQRLDKPDKHDLARLPHFGEAMGFYGTCVRLLSYTHDTVETMIAFLLMVIIIPTRKGSNSGVECLCHSDNRYQRYDNLIRANFFLEAFRRLYQFQAQMIAFNPRRLSGQDYTDLSAFYNPDMWPGVTNLVVTEMVKRSWSMFKVYLSNVAMELGRCTGFDDILIPAPTVVDDEVSLSQISSVTQLTLIVFGIRRDFNCRLR